MANLNLNKVILCGRLCADPELKQTPNNVSVVSFTLAVNRRYQAKESKDGQSAPQADFISVVAWRQTAEFISRYFRKGSSLCIIGNIQTRSWTDQNGQKRYATEVVAEEAMFVDSKSEESSSSATPPAAPYIPQAYLANPAFTKSAESPRFEQISIEDDLPF